VDCTSFRGSLLELRDQLLRQRQTLTVSRPFKPISASRRAHAGEGVSCASTSRTLEMVAIDLAEKTLASLGSNKSVVIVT